MPVKSPIQNAVRILPNSARAEHALVLLNIRDFTLVITFKQTHSSAPERRSSLQVALPNERRRPNAR